MSDAILDSAAVLFARRGYHAVGIRELADSVGLSTSTLYHYYATKQDILYAVIGRFLREFADTLVTGLRDTSVPPRARRASSYAAVSPATPPPIMATRFIVSPQNSAKKRKPQRPASGPLDSLYLCGHRYLIDRRFILAGDDLL